MHAAEVRTPELAEPFSAERTKDILDGFYRDGYAVIPNIITDEEIRTLVRGSIG